MMSPDVVKELQKENNDNPINRELFSHVRSLMRMSRMVRSRYYADWDFQEMVFRGLRAPDQDDRKQERAGRPPKQIVPNTFAQCMTFVSFIFLLLNQNDTFFNLTPNADEDYGTKQQDTEKLLQRDLIRNRINRITFQHLLDITRFGHGIVECSWCNEQSHIWVAPDPVSIQLSNGAQISLPQPAGWQQYTKYEGNLLRNVSPFRFFPDTRHPLSDFMRGEFVGSEEEYSKGMLRDMELNGEVAGIEYVQPMPRNFNEERGGPTRSVTEMDMETRTFAGPNKSEGTILVSKCQVWITPKHFKIGDKPLGNEEFRVLYHIWYANDNRLIKVEPARVWHNEFSYGVAEFTPDMHHTLTLGIADLIFRLQEVISWLINSHITSVRRVMNNRLIINPNLIDSKSLDGESDIYIRRGVTQPLDRIITQLKVQDVTGSHMGDADTMSKIMQMVTGINDNAMGQYNSGRRSAQESRVVTASASGRMKMHGQLIWESSFARLGRMMRANQQQSLSVDSFMRTIGKRTDNVQQRYMDWKETPDLIACGDSYFSFDGTLQSEKGFIASSLQELLVAIMQNPMAAQQLDLDPRTMLEEIQFLRGAGSMTRFSLSKNVANGAQPLQVPTPPQQPGQPTLPPNGNVSQVPTLGQ